jgi:O-antigen ligase
MFPGELFPELAPYRITLWLGILSLIVSMLTFAPTGKLTIRAAPIGLVAGLMVSMMLSELWADRWLGAPVHVMQQFGPALTLFLLAIWNVNSLRRLHITFAVLAFLAVALVAQGMAAYHFGYLHEKLLLRGSDNPEDEDQSTAEASGLVRVRGLGQMSDPNDLALVLVTTVPFLGLALKEGRTFRNLLLVGPPATLLIYGVYLTRSRGGMLGILAVFLVGLISRVSRTKALVATTVMATICMAANFTGGRAISTSEESAAGRIEAWSEGLAMFRSSPILGVGYQNFTRHYDFTAHNSFVLCFAELGAVGYFFWLALLVIAILQLDQVRRCVDDDSNADRLCRHAQVLTASFAGMLVAAFFLSRSYNPIVYLLVGLAFALYRIAGKRGHSMALPSLYGVGRKVVALELASILGMYVLVRVDRLFAS